MHFYCRKAIFLLERKCNRDWEIERQREIERDRESKREAERETDSQTDRQKDSQTNREAVVVGTESGTAPVDLV